MPGQFHDGRGYSRRGINAGADRPGAASDRRSYRAAVEHPHMEVRRVDGAAAGGGDVLDHALAVRRRVFVEEQDVPLDRELDGREAESVHFVAYADGDPVGAARLRPYDGSTGKVERVAVLEPERGAGVGRALMDAVEAAARDAGYAELVLHAQVPVVGFYERLSYEVTGEEFEDAGIPHREMRKRL